MCSLHRRDAGLGGRSANGDAIAQAHGYGGLNLRTLAEQVGIKAGSLYHHFPSKADLAAAVARRYAEDSAATLDALAAGAGSAALALRGYPDTFRRSLENNNRMCLCSFMAAEYDDLPAAVQTEIQAFADVNVAWLSQMLQAEGVADPAVAQQRARAIFAAVFGAQLMARGKADIVLFDPDRGVPQCRPVFCLKQFPAPRSQESAWSTRRIF